MRLGKLLTAVVPAVAAFIVLSMALPAQARTSERSHLYWNTPDKMGEVVEGAVAKLARDAESVELKLRTRGLDPGHAYTMWLVVFNRPENCVGNPGGVFNPNGACGLADGFSPLTEVTHYRAGGAVIGNDGVASISRRVDRSEPGYMAGEPGLVNPQGAEYMVVVRDHGPAVEGSDQTTTLNGGCPPAPPGYGSPGTNVCENEQMAFFAAG